MDLLWFSNILYRHYPFAREHEDKEPGWIKLYLAICHARGWIHFIHSDGKTVAGYIARPVTAWNPHYSNDPMHCDEYFGDCQFIDFAYGPNHYPEIISSLKEQRFEWTGWSRFKHKRTWWVATKKLRDSAFI